MAAATEDMSPVGNENVTPETLASVDTQNGHSNGNGDAVTVFDNPEHFNVKHPLMHEWTLWFTKPPTGKVVFFFSLFSLLPVTHTDRLI